MKKTKLRKEDVKEGMHVEINSDIRNVNISGTVKYLYNKEDTTDYGFSLDNDFIFCDNMWNNTEVFLLESENDREALNKMMDNDDKQIEKHLDKVWTDKHYNFSYKLTQTDINSGEVKIDPYFVYALWKLHEVDEYGILMHQLKTISRFGRKNDIKREVDALLGQSKRFKELVENK